MPDFILNIPILVRNKGNFGIGSNDINVRDVRALQRRLNEIEPGLRAELIREAKGVGFQAESLIKNRIPKTWPLTTSRPNINGRLAWDRQRDKNGRVLAPDHTKVEFRTSTGSMAKEMGKYTTSLVRVKVDAPMTVIADIAGRSGRAVGKGYRYSGFTRSFERNGVLMRYRINGQGQGLVNRLTAKDGRASRYGWPALINDKARLESEIRNVLMKYESIANRGYK